MHQSRSFYLLLLISSWLSLFTTSSHADHRKLNDTLVLAASPTMPPYILPNNDRGLAVDLLRASLKVQGLKLKVRYGNNQANVEAFNRGEVDIIFIANPRLTPNAEFAQQPLLHFENTAISLENQQLTLNNIDALGEHSLGAFPLAHKLLPSPFHLASEQSQDYHEYVNQKQQVIDLFNRKRDVVVLDRTIFRYFLSQLRRLNPSDATYHQGYRLHSLFPPRQYLSGFNTPELKREFDRGLATIQSNGEYQRINRFYQSLLADYLFE